MVENRSDSIVTKMSDQWQARAREKGVCREIEFGTRKTRHRRIREKSEKEIVGWRPVNHAQGRAIIWR